VIVDDGAGEEFSPSATASGMPEVTAMHVPEGKSAPIEESAPTEKPTAPVEAELFTACAAADGGIVSTASAGAFSASEQEFAYTPEQDDDDDEYDYNPEFAPEPDHAPELEIVREPEFAWETEPELQPEHKWEPEENEDEDPDKSEDEPHLSELTLF